MYSGPVRLDVGVCSDIVDAELIDWECAEHLGYVQVMTLICLYAACQSVRLQLMWILLAWQV